MPRVLQPISDVLSDYLDLSGLGTLVPFGQFELDPRTLLEAAIAISLNFGLMDEYVASFIRLDEPVTLGVVKPLYSTFRHVDDLYFFLWHPRTSAVETNTAPTETGAGPEARFSSIA